tara:strand:- start:4668 stop:4790 length:123 start_codon:yes stop_codon:yes gene_type:complete
MILDTTLTLPEAAVIFTCLGFIFSIFWYVGENTEEGDGDE